MLAQVGGDWISTLIWLVLFALFIMFGPRLMGWQTLWKLEKDVAELEGMANNARNYVTKSVLKSRKSKGKIKENIKSFMEFFAIPPVSLDPYGVVKKLDHIIRQSDQRFRYFVNQIAPDFSKERKMNLKDALAGAITTYQIAKIVRHNVEIVKKYKLYQLGMILQMQIPLIARIAKAAMHATHAFADGVPIGDGIGALVAANLMKGRIIKYEKDEFVLAQTQINGRKVLVAKAYGPGASTGYPGKFLQKVLKKYKINKIITVDAGLRLEGEKVGTIAEGVGIAMGGSGVDRYEIEEIAVQRNIPLDAIAVKVSDEEALMPMKKDIVNSVSDAINSVKGAIMRTRRNENIIVIGVGNTCGIGNTPAEASKAVNKIKKHIRRRELKKKKKS